METTKSTREREDYYSPQSNDRRKAPRPSREKPKVSSRPPQPPMRTDKDQLSSLHSDSYSDKYDFANVKGPARDPVERARGRQILFQPRLTARFHESTSASMPKDVCILWNPYSSRDTTVHLELGIEEDLETQLETFSRLKRLGHFQEAEEFFQTHLHDYLDLGPVLVAYTSMFLEQGAFNRLKEVEAEITCIRPFRDPTDQRLLVGSHTRTATITADRKFEICLFLIFLSSDIYSLNFQTKDLTYVGEEGFLRTTKELIENELHVFEPQNSFVDPLNIQILRYWLMIMRWATGISNLVQSYRYLDPWLYWPYWRLLYEQLLAEERIWEVRDIFIAASAAFGAELMWQKFFSIELHSPEFFAEFSEDWILDEYDESSYLAALEILLCVAQTLASQLKSLASKKYRIALQLCLDLARKFSTCIKENNPESIKSRSYLEWIITEESVLRKLVQFEQGVVSPESIMKTFPGLKLSLDAALPIYIPSDGEIPGWHAFEPTGRTNDLLKSVLVVARDLGDYWREANCLEELILRTEDPRELLEQLSYLRKSVQGFALGYSFNCFFKYLLATDDEKRQALFEELSILDKELNKAYVPTVDWCRARILNSLKPGTKLIKKSLLIMLPLPLQRDLESLGWVKNAVSDPMEKVSESLVGPMVLGDEGLKEEELESLKDNASQLAWYGSAAPKTEVMRESKVHNIVPLYKTGAGDADLPLTTENLRSLQHQQPKSPGVGVSVHSNGSDQGYASVTSTLLRNERIHSWRRVPMNQERTDSDVNICVTNPMCQCPSRFCPHTNEQMSVKNSSHVQAVKTDHEVSINEQSIDYNLVSSRFDPTPAAKTIVASEAPNRLPAGPRGERTTANLENPLEFEDVTIPNQRILEQDVVDEFPKLSMGGKVATTKGKGYSPHLDDSSPNRLDNTHITHASNSENLDVTSTKRQYVIESKLHSSAERKEDIKPTGDEEVNSKSKNKKQVREITPDSQKDMHFQAKPKEDRTAVLTMALTNNERINIPKDDPGGGHDNNGDETVDIGKVPKVQQQPEYLENNCGPPKTIDGEMENVFRYMDKEKHSDVEEPGPGPEPEPEPKVTVSDLHDLKSLQKIKTDNDPVYDDDGWGSFSFSLKKKKKKAKKMAENLVNSSAEQAKATEDDTFIRPPDAEGGQK